MLLCQKKLNYGMLSCQCNFKKMFNSILRRKFIVQYSWRNFSSSQSKNFKVSVVGACGGVGAPLSMLLKMNALIKELSIHDIVKHTPGVAADLSHIEYPAHVCGYVGEECLKKALGGSDIVVISAGFPRKPGMSRDDLFNSNASVVKSITEAISQSCPNAMIAIITNPINTVVPIACEILKSAGKLDPKRIFGITTLDNVRAAAFLAEKMKISPRNITVPVIGGHSGDTIVPLFSKAYPKVCFPQEDIKALTKRLQEAGTEVVKAKQGAGSATLSMAYAAARFVNSLLSAMKGEPKILECTYVQTKVCETLDYFAAPVVLGKNGVEKVCPVTDLNDFERELLGKAIPVLKKNIKKGLEYVESSSKKKDHDPCAEMDKNKQKGPSAKDDKSHQDPHAKGEKKHHDPSAKNDKKQQDRSARDDKKQHDPCAKDDKKHHDPSTKDDKKHHVSNDKNDKKHHDPSAKDGKNDKKKHDPCAEDNKKHQDPSAKDDKKHQDQKSKNDKTHHDPCAKDGKNDKKKHDPCAEDNKKHQDQSSKDDKKHQDQKSKNDKTHQDPCAKDGKNDKKKHDPCAEDNKKHQDQSAKDDKKHQDQKSKNNKTHQDPCAKDGKNDKKHDPCAEDDKKHHDKKDDPCAKFDKKEHHDSSAKNDKADSKQDSSAKNKPGSKC